MSKTLANLRDQLSIALHDYHHSTVTTALTASKLIKDTTLANIQGGTTSDYFNTWWALITSGANTALTPLRRIADYDGATYWLTVQGDNFGDDGAVKATYEIHKYHPTDKLRAINTTARKIFPTMHREILDLTLVSGNILPDSHFEWWTSATTLKLYTGTTSTGIVATLAKTDTAGLTRGGKYSAKVTAANTPGYMMINSNPYPRLLDLKNSTVSFYAWA